MLSNSIVDNTKKAQKLNKTGNSYLKSEQNKFLKYNACKIVGMLHIYSELQMDIIIVMFMLTIIIINFQLHKKLS